MPEMNDPLGGREAAGLGEAFQLPIADVREEAQPGAKGELDHAAVTGQGIRNLEDQAVRGMLTAFWEQRRERSSAANLNKVAQHEAWVEAFLERNRFGEGMAGDCARIFPALSWYATHPFSKSGDFSGLNFFGIDTTKIEAIWGTLRDLAQYYVDQQRGKVTTFGYDAAWGQRAQVAESTWSKFSTEFANAIDRASLPGLITSYFRHGSVAPETSDSTPDVSTHFYGHLMKAAEAQLAERLGVAPENVPLSYGFFRDLKSTGGLMPDHKSIVKFNQALLSADGANLFLFCCPDYAREQLSDGTFHYTMDGLGTGTGLTAERAMPNLVAILNRLSAMADSGNAVVPVNVRIGFADFEATPENAARCGMGHNQHEFLRRLGLSVKSVQSRLAEVAGEGLSLEQVRDEVSDDDPVGLVELRARSPQSGEIVSNISIGRVTDAFRPFHPDYNGVASFEERVAREREQLRYYGTVDSSTLEAKERAKIEGIRRALDTLLVLRLDLMLEWQTEEVPPYIEQLRGEMPFGNKAQVVRSLQEGMAAGDSERADALRYLRGKIAAQGAEYSVMHGLMNQAPNIIHVVADAANMWQLFGKKSIPVFGVRGGYVGSDVVDLS